MCHQNCFMNGFIFLLFITTSVPQSVSQYVSYRGPKPPQCLKFNLKDDLSILSPLSTLNGKTGGERGNEKSFLLWYCIYMTLRGSDWRGWCVCIGLDRWIFTFCYSTQNRQQKIRLPVNVNTGNTSLSTHWTVTQVLNPALTLRLTSNSVRSYETHNSTLLNAANIHEAFNWCVADSGSVIHENSSLSGSSRASSS